MNNNDIRTYSSSLTSKRNNFHAVAGLLHSWVTAYVAQYETSGRGNGDVDASARLHWIPIP